MSIPTHESTQWQGGSWNPGPPWTSQARVSSAPQSPPARRASRAHYCPLQSFPPQDSQSHPTELPLDLAIPASIESHPLGVKSSPSRTVRTLLPSQPPPSVTGSTALGSPQQLRPRTFPPPGKLSLQHSPPTSPPWIQCIPASICPRSLSKPKLKTPLSVSHLGTDTSMVDFL